MRKKSPLKARSRRTLRLTLAFQGTRYNGWQHQKDGKSLQELIESHLGRIFKEPVTLYSSSRTDSGVHAKALVAHCRVHSALADEKILAALNYYLPMDVAVTGVRTAAPDFHARFDAQSKLYEYRFWVSRVRPTYENEPFVLWCPYAVDVQRMRQAAKTLLGRHDFSAFRDSGSDDERDPVKTIQKLSIVKNGPDVRIRVQGDGFLRHMIRVIAGTLLEVGRGKVAPSRVAVILRSKDRKSAGPTAKAQGLTLLSVKYR